MFPNMPFTVMFVTAVGALFLINEMAKEGESVIWFTQMVGLQNKRTQEEREQTVFYWNRNSLCVNH